MILNIIRKEIQLLLREKGTFFWLIILPIIFIVMFASIFGNQKDTLTIRYYDADKSESSQQFITGLKAMKGFDLVTDTETPIADQIENIKQGKSTSLLVIPQGFGQTMQAGTKPADLEFYRDAAADTAVAPVITALQNVAYGYREVKLQNVLQASGKSEEEVKATLAAPFDIQDKKESSSSVNAISQYVPGYTVMFVFFILITMVRRFIKDKESGMVARLRSTAMKPIHYLIGMWIPNLLVVLIQCAVLLLFGNIVYDMSFGDPLAIALIVICLSICATGIGLVLSMLARSENQGVGVTQIVTMGGAVLGGLWFPYDFMPKFAQVIGNFTPQHWAQQAFQDVLVRGQHIADIWLALVILLAIGAAGVLIAMTRFKRFMLSATN